MVPAKATDLSLAQYEQLCADACSRFNSSGSRETDEEMLMGQICRKVYSYLGENVTTFFPVVDMPNLQAYEEKLHHLVAQRQSEPFNTLEIPRRHVTQGLQRIYG